MGIYREACIALALVGGSVPVVSPGAERERRACPCTGRTFFFFQAEDGIRDLIVTGVQTCALPISSFPGLDGVLLGAHPHWLTHSALPVWAMRRLGKKFDSYLRERERLIADGELDEEIGRASCRERV